MDPKTDALSKDDLYLLLESYKNSVEMNTLISQQLSSILTVLQVCKTEGQQIEKSVKDKIDVASLMIEKIRDKLEIHEKENIRSNGKIINRVNLLYVAIGSMVLSLFWIIYQLIDKYAILQSIASKLGA